MYQVLVGCFMDVSCLLLEIKPCVRETVETVEHKIDVGPDTVGSDLALSQSLCDHMQGA